MSPSFTVLDTRRVRDEHGEIIAIEVDLTTQAAGERILKLRSVA